MRLHAHIFFDLAEKDVVGEVRESIAAKLQGCAEVGALLLRAAGPLPLPMFQIDYEEHFASVVRDVLESCRGHRSVLIHPVMEDEVIAHTAQAEWLGQPLRLNLERL